MIKYKLAIFASSLMIFAISAPASAIYTDSAQGVPAGIEFKYENNPTVYHSIGGGPVCKRGYTSYEMFKNHNGKNTHIAVVGSNVQVPDCGGPNTIDLPRSGTVYRKSGQDGIFVYTNNGAYRFPSMEDFYNKGYRDDVIETFVTEQTSWGEANIWSRPDGTLFSYQNDPTVYQVANGEKMPFTSIEIYDMLFGSRSSIITMPANETFKTGGLINFFGGGYAVKGSGPQVYLTAANQIRPMSNYQVFLDLGFTPQEIIQIDDTELGRQSVGTVLN